MAKIAPGAALVELGVCKVAKVAEGVIHFKVFLFILMLMAGSTAGLLADDLVLFNQMGFVDIMNFLF